MTFIKDLGHSSFMKYLFFILLAFIENESAIKNLAKVPEIGKDWKIERQKFKRRADGKTECGKDRNLKMSFINSYRNREGHHSLRNKAYLNNCTYIYIKLCLKFFFSQS